MVLLVIFTVLLLFIIVLFIRNKKFDSQHRKQKKVIQKATNLYETILKIMPIGMAVFKGNPPKVTDCNDELTIMFDASKQHIIDHYFEDFLRDICLTGSSLPRCRKE